jgi:tetratricopeptide (TPR) repeat protein
VLVTSRRHLAGLITGYGAAHQSLDELPEGEAGELLERHIGHDRVAAEPIAVADLLTRCAGLPLAISIVAARAAIHAELPLAVLAEELRDVSARLDALDAGELTANLRAVFSWSYGALAPATANLFGLLGLVLAVDVGSPAVGSLIALPIAQVRELLQELESAHLVSQPVPHRYRMHDLVRVYAAECAHSRCTETERRAAIRRLLDHYLHTTHLAARLLYPHRDPLPLEPPAPGTILGDLTQHDQALSWFEAEHHALLAAVTLAAGNGFDDQARQLPWTLEDYFDRRGHWQDWASTQHAALSAAQRQGHLDGQARAHRSLGIAYARLGSPDGTLAHTNRALDLFRDLDDQIGEAHTHLALCWALDQQDRHQEAVVHTKRALELYRAADHLVGQARALNDVGWHYAQLGDHEQALVYCGQSLSVHNELGNRTGAADAWDSIGFAHHHLGHHTEALACYERALRLLEDLGDRYNHAHVLVHLGDTQHAAGDNLAARKAWQQALAVFDDLGHPAVEEIRLKLAALGRGTKPG